ncbi:unnamed protein product [Ectocarpus sp. CCAP 1310/34]|nr:unnamed protein product [Ectocarpus sp. CCAP 1310/34]
MRTPPVPRGPHVVRGGQVWPGFTVLMKTDKRGRWCVGAGGRAGGGKDEEV